jgi:hypothetical protein
MKFALISFVLSAFIFSTFSVANPQKLNSVKPYSFYSSYKFNGEHGGGENLWLWKTDEGKIIGLFNTYAGPMDIEYGRESAVKDFKTDQKTNEISFTIDEKAYSSEGKEIFTKYSFKGKVEGLKLKGTIINDKYKSARPIEMSVIGLAEASKQHSFFKSYSSLKEWEDNTPPKKTDLD